VEKLKRKFEDVTDFANIDAMNAEAVRLHDLRARAQASAALKSKAKAKVAEVLDQTVFGYQHNPKLKKYTMPQMNDLTNFGKFKPREHHSTLSVLQQKAQELASRSKTTLLQESSFSENSENSVSLSKQDRSALVLIDTSAQRNKAASTDRNIELRKTHTQLLTNQPPKVPRESRVPLAVAKERKEDAVAAVKSTGIDEFTRIE